MWLYHKTSVFSSPLFGTPALLPNLVLALDRSLCFLLLSFFSSLFSSCIVVLIELIAHLRLNSANPAGLYGPDGKAYAPWMIGKVRV
jgi:hypothetical protein